MRRIVRADSPLTGGDGILYRVAVNTIVALSAFRTIVNQVRVGVSHSETKSVRVALFEHDFQRIVEAASQWNAAPNDVVVLGILSQRLGDVSRKTSIGNGDPTRAGYAIA